MNIVVTGAFGFIGQNLCVHLQEKSLEVTRIGSQSELSELRSSLAAADVVYHLAGVNRPEADEDFRKGNVDFTAAVIDALAAACNPAKIIYASSTQALSDNPYGSSKRAAEDALIQHGVATGAPVRIFRLPNVFGKWARPNYNSAVATFCHNTARGLPITVNDANAALKLVHIDDVCAAMIAELELATAPVDIQAEVQPVYATTVGEVATAIRGFADSRSSLITDRVGVGLVRALYATYLSYLDPSAFEYQVPRHSDPRGDFVEMLKSPDSGQFSYFTAGPGVTRGQHYHHSKTEKFLVLAGDARFGFRHIITNERYEIFTKGGEARIVETIPGWTHDITNVGEGEMIVMLWANEIFDRSRPDTVYLPV